MTLATRGRINTVIFIDTQIFVIVSAIISPNTPIVSLPTGTEIIPVLNGFLYLLYLSTPLDLCYNDTKYSAMRITYDFIQDIFAF